MIEVRSITGEKAQLLVIHGGTLDDAFMIRAAYIGTNKKLKKQFKEMTRLYMTEGSDAAAQFEEESGLLGKRTDYYTGDLPETAKEKLVNPAWSVFYKNNETMMSHYKNGERYNPGHGMLLWIKPGEKKPIVLKE